MKTLSSFLALIAIVTFSQRAVAQEDLAFFSPNGDKVLHYYNEYNPDTKLWKGVFSVYTKGNTDKPQHTETVKMSSPISMGEYLDKLKSEHGTTVKGDLMDQNSGISADYKIVKKKKVGAPEGLYARQYTAQCDLAFNGTSILSDKTTLYSWGKGNKEDQFKKEHIYNYVSWAHPNNSTVHFGSFSIHEQELVLTMYRLSYIDQKVKTTAVRFF